MSYVECQKVHEDKETWWWNDEGAEAVRKKNIKYGNGKRENSTEAWKEQKKSKQNVKRVISSAKEKKNKKCASDLNDSGYQNEIFPVAKRR